MEFVTRVTHIQDCCHCMLAVGKLDEARNNDGNLCTACFFDADRMGLERVFKAAIRKMRWTCGCYKVLNVLAAATPTFNLV